MSFIAMLAFALPTFSLSLYGPLVAGLAALALLAFLGKVPINYSLRNLIVRWRTTLLTSLAFTLVIGLMIVMMAFVNGMSRLTEQSGQPGNVIVLSDGAIDELFSNFKYTETSDVDRQPAVQRDENGHPICSRETYLVAIQDTGTMKDNRPQRRLVQLRAIEDPEMAVSDSRPRIVSGREVVFRSRRANHSGKTEGNPEAIQAVLGEGIAREMGRDRGQDIAEGGRPVRTGRPHLDCGGHHEIGRFHIWLRSVGQVELGFAFVRQGAIHIDGGAYGGCRFGESTGRRSDHQLQKSCASSYAGNRIL